MATPKKKKGLGRSFEKLFGEGKIKQNLFQNEGEEEKITLDSTKNNIDVDNGSLFISPTKVDAEEAVEEADTEEINEVDNDTINTTEETKDESVSIATSDTPNEISAEESNEEKIVDSVPEDDTTSIEVEEKANSEVNEIVKEAESIASETVASENKENDDENEATGKPLYVPINHIHPNKDQPRKVFDEEKLNELANSIQNYGIISPIVVRRDGPLFYEIVTGERRYRAAKMLDLKTVPVIIKDFNDKTTKEIALIENIQREDLNPVEKAMGYQELIREYNMTQEELARILGKSKAAISNSIRILSLGPDIIKLMNEGQITEGHARALLGIDDDDFRRKVAEKVAKEKISVRKIEDMVRLENLAKNRKENERKLNQNETYRRLKEHIKEIREQMQKKLNNAKIDIIAKDENVGYINITYNNREELDNIYLLIKSIGENN